MRADMERSRDASLRPTVLRAVFLGVIASIIGIVLGLLINWFPAQGSTQSKKIDTFWDVLIICSVPVFVLVATVVKVIGRQFTWAFEYTVTNGKKFQTTQLYVPEGKSVRFDVVSLDVLHDFWVPAWRMKIDAVPGITTHYRITPVKTGQTKTYPVVCAELCGLGHAFMRQTAHVMPQADFNRW